MMYLKGPKDMSLHFMRCLVYDAFLRQLIITITCDKAVEIRDAELICTTPVFLRWHVLESLTITV